ncbi:hypothetical protein [Burkholderia vietnamiensis]|uniref:hypothetical protein n=1 Tax=Burkholderia vietnamiensis TaxID=60552 RepID=UPI001CF3860E|nr:hypothetical protein [Burkholderia vietnamiensis]MCA7945595.1 hypothetical protein [Burkholderia vietnamiensis]
MLIREIEGATRRLGAPADWDQSKSACDALPIVDVETDNGPFMVSAWQPTADELAALNAGASVRLWIQGTNHPVVTLAVDESTERYDARATETAPADGPSDGAADLAERAHLAAGQWANSNTPIAEALAYRDGFIAGARSPAMAAEAVAIPAGYALVPVDPTAAMLDRAVAFALNVKISGEYRWTNYMIDLWSGFLAAAPHPAQVGARAAPTDAEIEHIAEQHWSSCRYVDQECIREFDHADLMQFGRGLIAAHGSPDMSDAARDVLAERARQVGQEGWTPEHDEKYRDHELSCAAGCYAMHTLAYPAGDPPPAWPWSADWWKPTTHRRNLVKAGALILAEIEKLDRAESKA